MAIDALFDAIHQEGGDDIGLAAFQPVQGGGVGGWVYDAYVEPGFPVEAFFEGYVKAGKLGLGYPVGGEDQFFKRGLSGLIFLLNFFIGLGWQGEGYRQQKQQHQKGWCAAF